MVSTAQLEKQVKKLKTTNKQLEDENKELKIKVDNVFKLEKTVSTHYYESSVQNSKALHVALPQIKQQRMVELLAELCDFRLARDGECNFNEEIDL